MNIEDVEADPEHGTWCPDFAYAHLWLADQNDDPFDRDVHVTPTNDLRPHELHRTCWCRPQEDSQSSDVVIHQALDQRERYESGSLPAH